MGKDVDAILEPAELWPANPPPVQREGQPDHVRDEAVRRGAWIEHRVALTLQARIKEFVARPWQAHQRWRGMLLVGDAQNGRSSLLARALGRRIGGGYGEPAVIAGLPFPMTDVGLWTALNAGMWRSARPSIRKLRADALSRLERSDAAAFDALDPWVHAGQRLWPLLARLKAAGEDARVPVIVVATPAVAARIAEDGLWQDRFETLVVPRWRIDRDYVELLAKFEEVLPLEKPSHLAGRELAMHLYALSDGRIGPLARILREAALAAIENATEEITIPLLDALGLSPPASFKGFRY